MGWGGRGFALKGELLFFACTKKTNEKKVHPGRMALRASLVFRCLMAAVRRVILTRAALEWPSLAIHTSRASLLGILKGDVKSKSRAANLLRSFAGKETAFQSDGRGWVGPPETFANRKFAEEPTGTYLWRVSGGPTQLLHSTQIGFLKPLLLPHHANPRALNIGI